jgi:hypothetical protein
MTAQHIAASLAFALIMFSLSEYGVHRWSMHRMRLANLVDSDTMREMVVNHMAKHHKRDYHHDTHEEDDKLWQMQLAGLIPSSIVMVISYCVDPITAYVMFGFGVFYASFWWIVHLEMHRAEGRFFSRTALYRYLERRHQFHHVYPNTNFNVILPFGDWLFGTMPTKEQRAQFDAGNRRKASDRTRITEAA